MSFRNKILLINAVLFLLFVGLSVYGSIQFVKGSYNNQLDSIKSGIIGQNTKLVETFVQSQDALLEEKADFILEEVSYLSLTFEASCVRGYPALELIGENLKCVNQVATDYIKSIAFIDSAKNIEITLNPDGSTSIQQYLPDHTTLWSSDDAYKYKIVKDGKVNQFYILRPMQGYPDVLLKFELDLNIFAKSLSFEGLDSAQYRFLLVDEEGHFIASNWEDSFLYFMNSNISISGDSYPLRNYVFSDNANSFTVTSPNNENYNIIYRKNKAMGWRMLLITPESYLHSSFVSTRDLLLSSDNVLVEKIVFSSVLLFILFLALIYITVVKTFRPVNDLIQQANFLKVHDFNNAMDVVYHNGDEIEVLSQAYSDAGKTIKNLVEGLEREVKIRTDQYEKAAEEALDATKKKSTLLSNVSHEIRTPLNAIIGYLHILKKERCSTECDHELEGIKMASHTILDIVNDLLDFERLDSVNYTLHPKHVPINKIIRDIEKTFSPLAAQKSIHLSVMAKELSSAHQIYVDELRFQQALSNLITNAIKFTDLGEIEVTVSTDSVQDHPMVVFAVRDTGRGIHKEDLESIFNSFEQANKEDKQFGFGLGLAITKAIVTLMDGLLVVESEPEVGSVFKICLPIEVLTHNVISVDKCDVKDELPETVNESFVGIKALVVDDVEFNREILQYHLNEQGIECRTAIDGVDALERLEKESFDVILSDVSMPNMGGIELAQKSKLVFPDVPIIAVTARATVQEEETMRHYFDNYITKPIDETELITALSITLHK
ncbi:TPA: hybrid sensor histidine kinase/response regulator [Vibrio campbellii]|uniref:ATP-binding response regulator n=1 Tax=Vibrio campbellii TaxID=680 RepID=UPI003908DFDE